MPEYQDFEEIQHCGGKATFHIRCDADGRKTFSVGLRHDRPGPAAWAGMYASIPNGIVMSDFIMGGIGQAWNPPMPAGAVPVFISCDSHQRWGHQCPDCNGYFRCSSHPAVFPLTCPYCGRKNDAHTFITEAQQRYVQHYVETLVDGLNAIEADTEVEITIDFDAVIDELGDQPRPPFYYSGEAQQTRFTCLKCGRFNDIRGRFGYCATCGWRNNLKTLQTSFEGVRSQLNDGNLSPSRAVTGAVSVFDACCRDYATQVKRRIPMNPQRAATLDRPFHDIESAAIQTLKQACDIDLLRGILPADIAFANLMLHRRHITEHNAGVADERYVRESGDENAEVGLLIRENRENVHRFIGILARMAANFDSSFHEIFPPTEIPVRDHEGRQQH